LQRIAQSRVALAEEQTVGISETPRVELAGQKHIVVSAASGFGEMITITEAANASTNTELTAM
jgi:sulfopyruvate decarboxylase TPP-binding subunit